MNTSPDRGTFHSQCRREDAIAEGRDPDTDPGVLDAIERDLIWIEHVKQREADPKWKENNLEYDLRNTKWICSKAKASKIYAQNLYAAMCNNTFQKLDVWPLLKGETYSCSWRYAGGIVADMIEQGDYIDWYCSGIRGDVSDNKYMDMTQEEKAEYEEYKLYVPESVVTEEISKDLGLLGWQVVE